MKKVNQKSSGAGSSIFSWEFQDKETASASKKFYLIVSLIFALLIIYAFWTTNFLFGIFLLLFSFILVLEWQRPVQKEKVDIYQNGIQIANTFYDWKDIEKFSILYAPSTGSQPSQSFGGQAPRIDSGQAGQVPHHLGKIYFHFKGLLGSEVFVLFTDQDPNALRDFLKQYLKEDLTRDKEGFIDLIRHWLRL